MVSLPLLARLYWMGFSRRTFYQWYMARLCGMVCSVKLARFRDKGYSRILARSNLVGYYYDMARSWMTVSFFSLARSIALVFSHQLARSLH